MSKKVLVIDNDFFFVEFLSELLEHRGYDVVKATDGKDGISKLADGPFEFLFLEIVMPKIDGKKVIKFVRRRSPELDLPIIAVSGYLVEQMDELDEIGADYYIAKGTMEKMGEHVDAFLDKIEKNPHPDPDDKVFLEPGQVYPRQFTSEMMDILNFQKSIIDSAGIGLIIVDTDARIMHANPCVLEIIEKSLEDVLAQPITGIFPIEEKNKIVKALKSVIQSEDCGKMCFSVCYDLKDVQTTVSALNVHDKKSGWVIAMTEDVNKK